MKLQNDSVGGAVTRKEEADNNPKAIRISIDAKAKMNIGNFSRGGRKSRKNMMLTSSLDCIQYLNIKVRKQSTKNWKIMLDSETQFQA